MGSGKISRWVKVLDSLSGDPEIISSVHGRQKLYIFLYLRLHEKSYTGRASSYLTATSNATYHSMGPSCLDHLLDRSRLPQDVVQKFPVIPSERLCRHPRQRSLLISTWSTGSSDILPESAHMLILLAVEASDAKAYWFHVDVENHKITLWSFSPSSIDPHERETATVLGDEFTLALYGRVRRVLACHLVRQCMRVGGDEDQTGVRGYLYTISTFMRGCEIDYVTYRPCVPPAGPLGVPNDPTWYRPWYTLQEA